MALRPITNCSFDQPRGRGNTCLPGMDAYNTDDSDESEIASPPPQSHAPPPSRGNAGYRDADEDDDDERELLVLEARRRELRLKMERKSVVATPVVLPEAVRHAAATAATRSATATTATTAAGRDSVNSVLDAFSSLSVDNDSRSAGHTDREPLAVHASVPKQGGPQALRLLVPDTNALLTDSTRAVLTDLLALPSVLMVIPFIVLQELDFQQHGKRQDLAYHARSAARWLSETLNEKPDRCMACPWRARDGARRRRTGVANNDDFLVESAAYLAKTACHVHPRTDAALEVHLLSDDKVVGLKANAHRLRSCTPTAFHHRFCSPYSEDFLFCQPRGGRRWQPPSVQRDGGSHAAAAGGATRGEGARGTALTQQMDSLGAFEARLSQLMRAL